MSSVAYNRMWGLSGSRYRPELKVARTTKGTDGLVSPTYSVELEGADGLGSPTYSVELEGTDGLGSPTYSL
jgi:hypothetical protein